MNRIIKFRAWDGKRITNSGIMFNTSTGCIEVPITTNDPAIIVMQSLGITDLRGQEIYEGDILRVGANLTCEIIYIGENVNDMGDEIHAAFHAKIQQHNKIIPIDSYFKENCTVIGNVYQYPELLNKI
jgi:uncharacterized phage protein (TIGR01671 family)